MGGGKKILVVDDCRELREFYRLLIRKLNYIPVTAEDGNEAIRFLEGSTTPFALILLDLLMPQKTGWETLKQIRSSSHYDSIPIIVITGMVLPPEQVDRLRKQCDALIFKSEFSLDKLRQAIDAFLGDEQSGQAQ